MRGTGHRSGLLSAIGRLVLLLAAGALFIPLLEATLPDVRRAAAAPTPPPNLDDLLLRVAQRVPTFGGFYRSDQDNSISVWTTSGRSSDAAAAKAELVNVMQSEGRNDFAGMNLRMVKAKYGFTSLKDWLTRGDFFDVPGVVLTDIDDGRNRLEIGVANAVAEEAVRRQAAIVGLPQDAYSITYPGAFHDDVMTIRDPIRPIVASIEIGNDVIGPGQKICSLGANARHPTIGQGFITAGHCTKETGYDNGWFFQPNEHTQATAPIGIETEFSHFYSGGLCPSGEFCKHADVLFAVNYSGVTFAQGKVPYFAVGTIAWNGTDAYIIKRESSAVIGDQVMMVGQRSGRTIGTVNGQCVNVRNVDPNAFDYGVLYTCQSTATYTSGSGDSGAPIIRAEFPIWYHVALKGLHKGHFPDPDQRRVFSSVGQINSAIGVIDVCIDYSC